MGNIEKILNKLKDGEISVSEASSEVLKIQNEKVDKVVEKKTAELKTQFEENEKELKEKLSKSENELSEFRKETTKQQLDELDLDDDSRKIAEGMLEKGVSIKEMKKIMNIEEDVEGKVNKKITTKASEDKGNEEDGKSTEEPKTDEAEDIEDVFKYLDEI